MSSSSENRARIQVFVLGRFLPRYGDIELLCHFWRDIGVIVNHQSLFTDFNWTKEQLTVSMLFDYSKCLNNQSLDLVPILFTCSSRLKVHQPTTRYFIGYFVLQVIFHQMFLELVKDIGHHVVSTGEYGLEFANDGAFLLVFIRFWHEDQLCRVFLKRSGRTQGQNQSELTLVAHVMGALSTEPHIPGVRSRQYNSIIVATATTKSRVLPVLKSFSVQGVNAQEER